MTLKPFRSFALAAAVLALAAPAFGQTQRAPTAISSTGQLQASTPVAIEVAPAGGVAGPGRVVSLDNGLPIVCLSGCSGGGSGTDPFTPQGQVTLSAGAATTRVALTAGTTALLVNNSAVDLFYQPGNSAVNATTSSYALPSGRAIAIAVGANTHVAAITASGLASLLITTGAGTPVVSGGGGQGAGGSVSITGTLPAYAVTPTFNLGTLNGAATAAKQPALGVAGTASTDVLTVQGIAAGTPLRVDCVTGCSGGGGTGTASFTAATNGTVVTTAGTDKAAGLDLFGALPVLMKNPDGTVVDLAADVPIINGATPFTTTIGGSLPSFASTQTFNLGTLNGAATAAKQPTLGVAGTPSADVLSLQGVTGGTPLSIVASIPQAQTITGALGQPIYCRVESTFAAYADDTLNYPTCTTGGQMRVAIGDNNGVVATSNNVDGGIVSSSRVLLNSTFMMARGASSTFQSLWLYPQTLAANTNVLAVGETPSSSLRIAANTAGQAVKASAGALKKVCVGVPGASANLLTLYDNPSAASGTILAEVDTTTRGCLDFNLRASAGIYAVLATGTAASLVITFD